MPLPAVLLLLLLLLQPLPLRAEYFPFCSTQNTSAGNATFSVFQSVGACTQTCIAEAFAIIQGPQCWCSTLFPAQRSPSEDCSQPCPGYPSDKCGSDETNAFSYVQVGQATGTALPTPLSSPAPAAQTPPPVASPTILPSALPTPLPTTDLPAAPVVVSATAAPISLTPATDLTTNRSAAGALGVHDPPTPTNTTTIKPSSFFSNKAAVIGVFAIAAVAIVTIAGALFFLLLRRRRSRSASPRSHSSSFSDDRRSSIPVLANEKGEFFPIPIDQRLDALRSLQMTLENHSRKSLRDEEDYSRRLQVRNGSPGDNDFGD